MKQKIILVINYINLFSVLLLTAASIYYYYPLQNIAFYLFFISYILEFFIEEKWNNIKLDKKGIYYLVMAFFFILAFIYYPFENTSKYFTWLVGRRFAIFGFACVGFFGVNNKYKLNYFLNTFIISSIIAILYIIFYRIGIISFITNPDKAMIFQIERVNSVNSHMVFNLYLNIALVSIWYILTRSWKRTTWWKLILYFGALTLIFGILSISEGRIGLITGFILMFIFIFFEIWKRKKIMGIVFMFLIPFLLFGALHHRERMSEKVIKTEPRVFLWEAALSVIKEKPVFGYGISNAQEQFDIARAKYETIEYRLNWKHIRILTSHNQFLQTTMEFGIFGLIILLFLFFYPIFIADKNRKLFAVLLIFPCVYQSLFDVFMTGLNYSSIWGILMVLILSVENNIVQKAPKKELTT
jgi:O-antigen ligase